MNIRPNSHIISSESAQCNNNEDVKNVAPMPMYKRLWKLPAISTSQQPWWTWTPMPLQTGDTTNSVFKQFFYCHRNWVVIQSHAMPRAYTCWLPKYTGGFRAKFQRGSKLLLRLDHSACPLRKSRNCYYFKFHGTQMLTFLLFDKVQSLITVNNILYTNNVSKTSLFLTEKF